MSIKKDGIMVILSSPSGAGKTTLVNLLSKEKKFQISISHTTRQARSNEVADKDYYFINHEKFEGLIKNEEFLEYAKVFKHLYGTTRTPVIEKLEKGENVIFDIDWQGADQIKNKKLNYKLITFFILPPSKEVLFERLSNRDMKDKLIVEERMKEFSRDVLHWINYDYVIVNDNLEECYSKISNLIDAEINNGSKDYDKEYIRKHVNSLTS
ncbi:guanylate kinase [Candidatus Pelagibacter sp.]|jgi:guanylate kinase|nr:guanylate kinase [Candidatus Pelagibacter sp.]